MSATASPFAELIIDADERIGAGGFLVIRRLGLRNRRADGSISPAYGCDFLERPAGLDAVGVAIFRRTTAGVIEILLRRCLRPAVALGRDADIPFDEPPREPFSTEIVAGLIEPGDRGHDGIRQRAAAEVAEEAGFDVDPDDIVALGAPTMPVPGTLPEKLYLTAVEVPADAVAGALEGDGSPMEEGGETWWLPIDAAIEACVSGEVLDAKTELCLRRLRDRLAT